MCFTCATYLFMLIAMVCFLLDGLDVDLPQTETEIYEQFTRHTLFRAIKRSDSDALDSMESLPKQERDVFISICKLAFEKTLSGKQVMKQSEVKHFFNPESKDCLGLITIDVKAAILCRFEKMYTFLHLTFQLHITSLV